jgi:hypothetical protein
MLFSRSQGKGCPTHNFIAFFLRPLVTSAIPLKPRPDVAERPEGFIVQPSTGEHAHDLYLQTWYELGVLGVILVAWAGAATALDIYLLPSAAQAFAATTFFVCLAIETFAWSMWQPWLMCAVSLLAIYVRVASDTCEDDRAVPIQPET